MIEMIQSISSINKYTNEQDCTRCKTNGCRMKHYLQINIVCSHSRRLRCFLAAALRPRHIKCNLLRRRLKARLRTTFVRLVCDTQNRFNARRYKCHWLQLSANRRARNLCNMNFMWESRWEWACRPLSPKCAPSDRLYRPNLRTDRQKRVPRS